jgi:hypothetical protein
MRADKSLEALVLPMFPLLPHTYSFLRWILARENGDIRPGI